MPDSPALCSSGCFSFSVCCQVAQSVSALSHGSRVVSEGSDGTIRVWDVETGECEGLALFDIFVDGLAVSPTLFLDLPFAQVWVVQSQVLICHKMGEGIVVPPPRPRQVAVKAQKRVTRGPHCSLS
jgi:WD40 repeat protein